MDTIKDTANYVQDKTQSTLHGTSKEANKQTAKDSNAPIGSRLESAGNAVTDKTKEMGRDSSAEANKQSATHR